MYLIWEAGEATGGNFYPICAAGWPPKPPHPNSCWLEEGVATLGGTPVVRCRRRPSDRFSHK